MSRDHPPIWLPPPVAWGFAVAAAAGLQWLTRWPWHWPGGRWLGALVAVAATALVGWALIAFRRAKTPVDPFKTPRALVESGPYRWTRNPIYIGLVAWLVAIGLIGQWPWFFVVAAAYAGFLDRGVIRPEERFLAERFGDPYRAYCRRTRRWL